MDHEKVKYIKPPNLLKLRIGSGGIPKERLKKADEFIKNYKIDFAPIADVFLDDLSASISQALKQLQNSEGPLDDIEHVLTPIIQLKAHGGMFQYRLISDVADICQQFIETLSLYDQEALAIIQAHENAIKAILDHTMKGDGGERGYELLIELDKACRRYFKKHNL
ncbi:MAG: hypothetical protein KTR28_03520 [Micavibrio sp.]|nr:hypothetical protein [Micavibrio sp.]